MKYAIKNKKNDEINKRENAIIFSLYYKILQLYNHNKNQQNDI